jgi:hypothetical protein
MGLCVCTGVERSPSMTKETYYMTKETYNIWGSKGVQVSGPEGVHSTLKKKGGGGKAHKAERERPRTHERERDQAHTIERQIDLV